MSVKNAARIALSLTIILSLLSAPTLAKNRHRGTGPRQPGVASRNHSHNTNRSANDNHASRGRSSRPHGRQKFAKGANRTAGASRHGSFNRNSRSRRGLHISTGSRHSGFALSFGAGRRSRSAAFSFGSHRAHGNFGRNHRPRRHRYHYRFGRYYPVLPFYSYYYARPYYAQPYYRYYDDTYEKTTNQQPVPDTYQTNAGSQLQLAVDKRLDTIAAAFATEEYDRAVKLVNLAVADYPGEPVLRFVHSQALFAAGHYANSAVVLRRTLDNLTTIDPELFYPAGLYPNQQALDKQIDNLRMTIAAYPDKPELQLLLGYQLLGTEKLTQAEKALDIAAADRINRNAATLLKSAIQKAKSTPTEKTP